MEGITYRLRVGAVANLPAGFGPWQTGWKHHNRFAKDGIWDRVLTYLRAQSAAVGELDWTVSVDSTVARLHQRGATANRSRAARRTQAYLARAHRDQLWACQVTVVIPERAD